MFARACVVCVLLIGASVYASGARRDDVPGGRPHLERLPLALGAWHGIDTEPLEDDVVAKLGVDDYVSRRYMREGAAPVALYVGYYHSQRQGDTIHSPQNCLPGAGWQPVESGTHRIGSATESAEVNRYVIAKGLNQQVVFYWYQGRGRIVANEYANKFYLMFDAARLGRTDGALVRIIAPVVSTPAAATDELERFARVLLPHLNPHLP